MIIPLDDLLTSLVARRGIADVPYTARSTIHDPRRRVSRPCASAGVLLASPAPSEESKRSTGPPDGSS
jgi:hypothetical protein